MVEDLPESCLYGIIGIRITPFLGVWFIVSSQLYYTIASEELFGFYNKNSVFMRLLAFCKRLCGCILEREVIQALTLSPIHIYLYLIKEKHMKLGEWSGKVI